LADSQPNSSPTFVYDGDCGICRYWVDYWRGLTDDRVDYRPYQEAAADFPAISPEAFRRAVQYIEPDGATYSGAAATFRLLRNAPGRAPWWWLYAGAPGFAPVSERAYAFFARRRGWLDRISKILWGPVLQAERYDLVSWVFLRLLGAIYFAAFFSLAVQIDGLVGSAGILPLDDYIDAARRQLGSERCWVLPTLFWFNTGDTALIAGTVVGCGFASLVMLDRWTRSALVALFALYLSYVYAGQDFMRFQWDSLLLETGFLAIFLTGGSRIVVWLYRWLAFRYLLLAGAVKLLSGDATWRGLTALDYHFWTQPLPTPFAWYAAQLPSWVLVGGTAATLAFELLLVFLIFLPRRPRAFAASGILVFQVLILLTGNYNFFNLLSMAICLFLFDDAALRRAFPSRLAAWARGRAPQPGRHATAMATALALIVVPIGINRLAQTFARADLPIAGSLSHFLSPLMIVNSYGLFAVMTTSRPEIVIEGSADGKVWREYDFHYKPGPVARRLVWNIPHQPRLDWQMWFAALGDYRQNPWFASLVLRLLQGSAPVLGLLDSNPFPEGPPKFIRARLYDYRPADAAAHARTGDWWARRFVRWYFPQVTLADFTSPGSASRGRPAPR
jgi:predicted DCC family thiol-disulfide oxidoreductase YuxK